MRIGIFFGGPSRERDVSFAGGRTALANLNKALFDPVLVFVSGWGRFYIVEPDFLENTSIRAALPEQDGFSVYDESLEEEDVIPGEQVDPEWFEDYFDMAFLAMHGPDCEDGAIQGLLEWHKMPYTGPGILGSGLGINKILQNNLIALVNGQEKKTATITRDAWNQADQGAFFTSLVNHLGLPVVVKAPHQGSSIGVAIVRENDLGTFQKAVGQCFFTTTLNLADWANMEEQAKHDYAQKTATLSSAIGYPLIIENTGEYAMHPADLIEKLDDEADEDADRLFTLASVNAEDELLFEEFINGQEFSCGVIQDDDGLAVALPPTEIYNADAFDYETKYLTSVAKKRIPVGTSLENNRAIQVGIEQLFTKLGINVYSRIDGFLTPEGPNGEPQRVLFHDPNTIPGMSPTSLIFKQMAEIGMNLSDSLTYLIRQSLRERIRTGKDTHRLKQMLTELDAKLAARKAATLPEQVIHFGPTDDDWNRAKGEYNAAAALAETRPQLVYLKSKVENHEVPVYFLFKDTLTELEEALTTPRHPLLIETQERARHITERYI
ncbi:D-alanine--D-alanine ligase family protein [Fibrella aquatica]|uniref:D-alanine--D-alanine ligase family protein n=1 Tax=Fibrella aquatica TaxID=3242487 RepID=UPI003520DAFC